MSDPAFGENEFLSVRIGGRENRPERLLLIGRPESGSVRVREWTTESWNREGDDYDVDASTLLREIEGAHNASLGVTPEIYRIQLWMRGLGG